MKKFSWIKLLTNSRRCAQQRWDQKSKGSYPLALVSDPEQGSFAFLQADNRTGVDHLLEQSGSLLHRDVESLARIGCGHALAEDAEQVSLQTLVFDLSLRRLADTVGLADRLERTLYEEVEVSLSQSFEVDAVDSFSDCHFFHVLTPYLSYIYSLSWIQDFVKTFFWRIFRLRNLMFSVHSWNLWHFCPVFEGQKVFAD